MFRGLHDRSREKANLPKHLGNHSGAASRGAMSRLGSRDRRSYDRITSE
jgi:hypothetical protein